ncbi:helix-turn-helix domain-containing protein [Lacisediminihabitans changchengi]|uniref:Helix-turn-helix transcriptional regulator n=1 Tax=Lacisediminihabitans changchengi TaxID=2787634 RepID=A0A934W4Y4_9MICO|nr:helix-turn-helix transcriptional regulator [Lacisediminihabitans changchengi]MBK4348754.1 helix-turn-helix transcriptional regulator [Lacisediminihabitans changchengi]
MDDRKRGNPAGQTNEAVAANLRKVRQSTGVDLRELSARIKTTGRVISPSALSKIENGDRRVDVDDLTVFAYALETTPAALLTPASEEAQAPAGVPEGQFTPEEIRAWIQGTVKLTTEDLLRYWKEQAFDSASYIRRSEDILAQYDQGQVGVTPREVYEKRIATHRGRLATITGRQLELDPMSIPIDI